MYHFVMPVQTSSGKIDRKGISEVPVDYHFTQRLEQEENVRCMAVSSSSNYHGGVMPSRLPMSVNKSRENSTRRRGMLYPTTQTGLINGP